MSIADAREGLVAACASTGLRAHRVWPNQISPPAAIVLLTSGEYNQAFQGVGTLLHFLILVVTQISNLEAAQAQADEYLEETGGKSIYAAILMDTRLGNRVQYARPIGITQYEPQGISGVDYVVPAIDVEVMI